MHKLEKKKKAKHFLRKEVCKYQMLLWCILSGHVSGDYLLNSEYNAPVTRFSSRKLHFDKISSPHQHLLYPSVCLLIR